jgi:hypothetical protein
MHEARHGTGGPILRRENHGRSARRAKLLSIEWIGEKRNGVGSRARQRADAADYRIAIAVELTVESRRELA